MSPEDIATYDRFVEAWNGYRSSKSDMQKYLRLNKKLSRISDAKDKAYQNGQTSYHDYISAYGRALDAYGKYQEAYDDMGRYRFRLDQAEGALRTDLATDAAPSAGTSPASPTS